jgi:hypothetical protein
MSLATFSDANDHLDQDKVRFENAADAIPEAQTADTYVRGMLADSFGAAVVVLWDANPTGGQTATPELVREIAGMWMAAERYDKKYSLEQMTSDSYSNRLRKRANDLIDMLRSGEMSLVEVGIISGVTWSEGDFWPNSTTVDVAGLPDRKFTMDMEP